MACTPSSRNGSRIRDALGRTSHARRNSHRIRPPTTPLCPSRCCRHPSRESVQPSESNHAESGSGYAAATSLADHRTSGQSTHCLSRCDGGCNGDRSSSRRARGPGCLRRASRFRYSAILASNTSQQCWQRKKFRRLSLTSSAMIWHQWHSLIALVLYLGFLNTGAVRSAMNDDRTPPEVALAVTCRARIEVARAAAFFFANTLALTVAAHTRSSDKF